MVEKTLSAADLPKLVVQLPDGREVHYPVVGSEISIGRDPSNRIPIADQFVSKFHAKLLITPTSLTLVDLGSANKTYVNGELIREAAVRYGDELQFAGVRCRLVGPDAEQRARAAPPPPPAAKPAPSVPRASAPPPPVPSSAQAPAVKQKAAAAPQPRSAPPKIEADPMKKLLRIGGLLIAVSIALAVMLRVLLVPSGSSGDEQEGAQQSQTTAETATTVPPEIATTAPPQTQPPAGTGASSAEEYFEQGLSHLDTGRLRDARTAFQKVLEIEPNNARAKTRLSLLEEEISKKADQHFGNARQAFQYLRYEEAIGEWEIFLTLAETSDVRYSEAQQGIEQAKAKLR
jgi:cytochrome c-type biogenesis protein CcmH/NrfG